MAHIRFISIFGDLFYYHSFDMGSARPPLLPEELQGVDIITDPQFYFPSKAFVRINNTFGLTSRTTHYATNVETLFHLQKNDEHRLKGKQRKSYD